MTRRAFASLAGLTVGLACGAAVLAQDGPVPRGEDEQVPQWEIGVVAGGAWVPHYPAADQGSSLFAAIPYFIYRWERVRIGENGLISGRLFDDDRVGLTLSVSGALPANSKDNRARAGMPDLDALAEMGPQLEVTLTERADIDSLKLKLPLRAVVSTDFSRIDYRGVVFRPNLFYTREDMLDGDLEGTISIGPIFASELLMNYFYDVPPAFATPNRPAHEASGGYMGSALLARVSYDITDRLRVFIGGGAGYYGGARNRNSPLFRDSTNFSVGAGLRWKIWISEKTVAR